MERFETERNPEAKLVAKLADDAQYWELRVDLKRKPNGHIHKALELEHIRRDDPAYNRLIGEIAAELRRRKPAPLSERKDLIEDARRLEARHPKEDEEK